MSFQGISGLCGLELRRQALGRFGHGLESVDRRVAELFVCAERVASALGCAPFDAGRCLGVVREVQRVVAFGHSATASASTLSRMTG